MKSSLTLLTLTLLAAAPALADSWVADCNDLHFTFDRTSKKASVYVKTNKGIFQISTGTIGFDNDVAVRAPLAGLPEGVKGAMTEIGLNRDRNVVYVLYRNPDTGQTKDGVFCSAPITVEK
jgi:hypothetical protein